MTAALSSLGELLGFGAKEAPNVEELTAKLKKVAAQIKKVRAQLKKTTSSSQKTTYQKQVKALRGRLRKLKRLLAKHKGDKKQETDSDASSEIEESEETELSGPILDRVGGFVSQRPIVSLLLAALAGAVISRRLK